MPRELLKRNSTGRTKLNFLHPLLYPNLDKGKFPKVLVGCPIYDAKSYCFSEYFDNVKQLSYPNYDLLFVDNSDNKEFHEMVAETYDVPVIYSGAYHSTRERQCNSYKLLREKFLEGDYEYLMVIESDIFPKHDIIQQLMQHDFPITSAVYWIFSQNGKHLSQPCVTSGQYKYSSMNSKWNEQFIQPVYIDGEVRETHGGCGLGCCLIKREVLEKIDFRYGERQHADTFFHRDAHREGFPTWLDMGIVVSHYPSHYPQGDKF